MFLIALRCFGRFVVFPQISIPLKWEIFGTSLGGIYVFLMAFRCFGRFVVFSQISIPLKWEIIILMVHVCPRMEKQQSREGKIRDKM